MDEDLQNEYLEYDIVSFTTQKLLLLSFFFVFQDRPRRSVRQRSITQHYVVINLHIQGVVILPPLVIHLNA